MYTRDDIGKSLAALVDGQVAYVKTRMVEIDEEVTKKAKAWHTEYCIAVDGQTPECEAVLVKNIHELILTKMTADLLSTGEHITMGMMFG